MAEGRRTGQRALPPTDPGIQGKTRLRRVVGTPHGSHRRWQARKTALWACASALFVLACTILTPSTAFAYELVQGEPITVTSRELSQKWLSLLSVDGTADANPPEADEPDPLYIKRFKLDGYATGLYNTLVKAATIEKNEPNDDNYLINSKYFDPSSEDIPVAPTDDATYETYTYKVIKDKNVNATMTYIPVGKVEPSLGATAEQADPNLNTWKFNDVAEKDMEKIYAQIAIVLGAFNYDHPEVFWLSGDYKYGIMHTSGDDGAVVAYYPYMVIASPSKTYSLICKNCLEEFDNNLEKGIEQRDASISEIVTYAKGKVNGESPTSYQYMKYFNEWLTSHNEYNTKLHEPGYEYHFMRECMSALKGQIGGEGPVCEGYAKAFKLLCNNVGIPCILTTGDAYNRPEATAPEPHMWNLAQVDKDSGNWYGVDVTWDDPSGWMFNEACESYLLVGSDSIIGNQKFSKSHVTTNQPLVDKAQFMMEPKQSTTAYIVPSMAEDANIESAVIKIPDESGLIYTGNSIEPGVTVTLGSQALIRSKDYIVDYDNNVNAGTKTATVKVLGRGKYTGIASKTFTIGKVKESLSANSTTSLSLTVGGGDGKVNLTYNGAGTLVASAGSDGVVEATIKDNVLAVTPLKVGEAKVTVSATTDSNHEAPAPIEISVSVSSANPGTSTTPTTPSTPTTPKPSTPSTGSGGGGTLPTPPVTKPDEPAEPEDPTPEDPEPEDPEPEDPAPEDPAPEDPADPDRPQLEPEVEAIVDASDEGVDQLNQADNHLTVESKVTDKDSVEWTITLAEEALDTPARAVGHEVVRGFVGAVASNPKDVYSISTMTGVEPEAVIYVDDGVSDAEIQALADKLGLSSAEVSGGVRALAAEGAATGSDLVGESCRMLVTGHGENPTQVIFTLRFRAEAGTTTPDVEPEPESVVVYRLYNEFTTEHLFTTDENEYRTLGEDGWTPEGEAWRAPKEGAPVWRLYNPYTKDHHYTLDADEYAALAKLGWNQEGEFWKSADSSTGRPVYRLFNPFQEGAGAHHYTIDDNEYQSLPALGWRQEEIGWWSL